MIHNAMGFSTGVFEDETKWDGSFATLAMQRGVHGVTIENVLYT